MVMALSCARINLFIYLGGGAVVVNTAERVPARSRTVFEYDFFDGTKDSNL
jgi:hypothetical protein